MPQRCYFAAHRYDHKMRRDGLILWAKLIFRLSNGIIFQTEFESEHPCKVYGQQLHKVSDLIFSNLKKRVSVGENRQRNWYVLSYEDGRDNYSGT